MLTSMLSDSTLNCSSAAAYLIFMMFQLKTLVLSAHTHEIGFTRVFVEAFESCLRRVCVRGAVEHLLRIV